MIKTGVSPTDDTAPLVLERVLRFVALCIQRPCTAAIWVALFVTGFALAITVFAATSASTSGAGLAALYVASCWTLAICLRLHGNRAADDT